MKIIRFIGKIAALPLAVIAAVLGFLFNLAINLSGYLIGPAMLLILGFDIWFLFHAAAACADSDGTGRMLPGGSVRTGSGAGVSG